MLFDSRQSFPVIKDSWSFAPCSHLASVFRSPIPHVLYFQSIHRQVTFACGCFICPKKHEGHHISSSSYPDILLWVTNGVCRPGRGLRRMSLPSLAVSPFAVVADRYIHPASHRHRHRVLSRAQRHRPRPDLSGDPRHA